MQYFTPYQLEILENFWKKDDFCLTAARRAGKSFFFTYLAIRQLFLKNQTVVYLVPSEKAGEQPMLYIKRFLEFINKVDKNIKIKSNGEIFNSDTNSVLWLVSSGSEFGARSKEATLAIIDEASYVPDAEAKSLQTMVEQIRSIRDMRENDMSLTKVERDTLKTTGKLLMGTTVSVKNPKNWYYDEVMDIESGLNEDGLSVRVGIYQCPFYTEKRREKIISKLKSDVNTLKCELLAEFPSGESRMDMDNCIIDMPLSEATEEIIDVAHGVSLTMFPPKKVYNETMLKRFKVFLSIWYDVAKKSSASWVVLTEIYVPKLGTMTGFKDAMICPVGELDIPKFVPFPVQVSIMKNLLWKMEDIYWRWMVHLGIDSTGIWEVVSDTMREKWVPHQKVQYVSAGNTYSAAQMSGGTSNEKFYFQRNGTYYVKKPFLMGIPSSLAVEERFKIYKLPKTYRDFGIYNDVLTFDAKKHSVDHYHAACISMMTGIITNPEVYFYNEGTTERNNARKVKSDMQKYMAMIWPAGFRNTRTAVDHSVKSRFTKFGY